MSDLDALLGGIVAHPHEHLRWLVMADWLEDHGFPERAELVRVHRELLRTCTDPDAHPEREELHARMMELMRAGVQPCLPQKTLTLPGGVELRMSFVPPGSFFMGSPEDEPGRGEDETLHLVTLTKGFWLGQTPVTQRQWGAVMGRNPSLFKGDELPVDTVSWENAAAFCATVRARTSAEARHPTESEWEYAARAGTVTPFYWGGELNGTQASCDGSGPYGTEENGLPPERTTAVGAFASASPHPWGLVDLIGNVMEWCWDWHESNTDAPAVDPAGPEDGSFRVLRGGSWYSYAGSCRSACRDRYEPHDRCYYLGFRIAADLE